MKVLLSIKPEFARKIITGEKQYEFRRTIFKREDVKNIVIYATSPVKKVIGEFVIGGIIKRKIDELWEETCQFGGIEKDAFDTYFSGKDTGFAIKVERVIEYENPRNLDDVRPGLTPPQSFAYI